VSGSPDAPAAIALRLSRADQLFNSLDPSPFHEKDLDADAEEYIVESAREIGNRTLKVVVELPANEIRSETAAGIGEGVRHYFAYRHEIELRRFRLLFRRGWVSLVIGLTFLIACLSGRQFLSMWTGPTIEVFSEGLLILGWVAMWRPLEVFLYDWWPIAGTCRVLTRLAAVDVELRPANQSETR
jgi:hypothetical protein